MKAWLCTFLLAASFLLIQISPATAGVEEDFFQGAISTRLERLEKYPLEQQYRIFLYGNQIIHPPATGLAVPIAKRGKVAADYILEQLTKSTSDLDFRDSLVVFQFMQWGGYFNICGHPDYLNRIIENQSKLENEGWRKVYVSMLADICRKRK